MGVDHETVIVFPNYLYADEDCGGDPVGRVRTLASWHAEAARVEDPYGAAHLLDLIAEHLPTPTAYGRPVFSSGNRIGRSIRSLITDEYESDVPPLLPFPFDVLVVANQRFSNRGVYEQIRATLIHSDDGGGGSEDHPWQTIVEVYLDEDRDGASFLCAHWIAGSDEEDDDQVKWSRTPVEVFFAHSMLVVDGKLAPDLALPAPALAIETDPAH